MFKDYLNHINYGIIIWTLKWIVPTFIFPDRGPEELSSTLDEIEEILKYSKKLSGSDVESRPVIITDEVSSMMPLISGSAQQKAIGKFFVEWLVSVTKDKWLCDVIFASHNGFSLQILSLSDPLYVTSVTIPDLTSEDMMTITNKNPDSMNASYINVTLKVVGGHASHVQELLKSFSHADLRKRYAALKVSELETVQAIRRTSQEFCTDIAGGSFKVNNIF